LVVVKHLQHILESPGFSGTEAALTKLPSYQLNILPVTNENKCLVASCTGAGAVWRPAESRQNCVSALVPF